MNNVAGRTLHIGAGRGRLLAWADGLECCGPRTKRQFVAVYGGRPQELKLREENEYRRDSAWNRPQAQMSHDKLTTTNIRVMPERLAKPIIPQGLILVMPNWAGWLQKGVGPVGGLRYPPVGGRLAVPL